MSQKLSYFRTLICAIAVALTLLALLAACGGDTATDAPGSEGAAGTPTAAPGSEGIASTPTAATPAPRIGAAAGTVRHNAVAVVIHRWAIHNAVVNRGTRILPHPGQCYRRRGQRSHARTGGYVHPGTRQPASFQEAGIPRRPGNPDSHLSRHWRRELGLRRHVTLDG